MFDLASLMFLLWNLRLLDILEQIYDSKGLYCSMLLASIIVAEGKDRTSLP